MAKLREEDKILRERIKLRVIELRERKGASKSDFSIKVDIDRQNVQPWENLDSERGPTIYSISRICKAFEISLKEFFDSDLFSTK